MITWYAQEQETSCVAACIRIVLSGFGQQLTEKRVRKILGNPSFGLSLPQACQRLTQAGLKIAFHDNLGLLDLRDCLRDGWYPIVGLERRFFGRTDSTHAVVLVEIDSRAVRALDPLGGSAPEIYSPETFELAWNSAGHQALVIKAPLSL
jgi:ABC-type bacteriocin/lantibiotic exporter with double-glycine peptidase domain